MPPLLLSSLAMKTRFVIALCSFLIEASVTLIAPGATSLAATSDLLPPQVTADYIFPPSPLLQDGKAWLVYEMKITDYIPKAYTLESIDVSAGTEHFSY